MAIDSKARVGKYIGDMLTRLTKSVHKAADKLTSYLDAAPAMDGSKEVARVKSLQPTKCNTVIQELVKAETQAKARHTLRLIPIAVVS